MKNLLIALTGLIALSPAHAATDPQELLEPDQAFALTLKARDAQTIEASWKIADGYYMYRDKFKFESLDSALSLKPAVIPAGKKKSDPAFGTVETYTKTVTATLPIERRADGTQIAKLRITGQGCNEPIGVCYPPITKELSVSLPALKVAAADTKSGGVKSLKDLSSLIEPSGGQEFLPPDQAFQLSTESIDANTASARIRIAPGYYLYRDKTTVKLLRGEGISLDKPEVSRGKLKDDPTFGKTEVIYDELTVRIPLKRSAAGTDRIELEIGYQGCADKGICYPPEKKKVSLRLPAAGADKPDILTTQTKPPRVEGDTTFSLLLAAFGAGLLLTFTPCVLPMIPILTAIIAGEGDDVTPARGLGLAFSYVMGMAIVYTAAGVVAVAAGAQVQAAFNQPWVLSLFAVLFVVLAIAMFGAFDLQMPSSVQSRLSAISNNQKSGTVIGAFVMGALSSLIVTACVAPALVAALAVMSQSGDYFRGGLALFAMSLGMGAPLLLVGAAQGKFLPKAGPWMVAVKGAFGFMMLGLAVWMLSRFLPATLIMAMWAVLVFMIGVFMGGLTTLTAESTVPQKLGKGFGGLAIIYGILLVVGA
ncbi:MAG TPA: thiol:disulfide interchange protein, partial [Gammaproteobacteria bacterium]|nr:thiol:disulfide interchange protein [Gammaproteobacteria bacterium]